MQDNTAKVITALTLTMNMNCTIKLVTYMQPSQYTFDLNYLHPWLPIEFKHSFNNQTFIAFKIHEYLHDILPSLTHELGLQLIVLVLCFY